MLDLTDRKNIFYWQTDRKLSAEDYARIFLKRHEVTDGEFIDVLNNGISKISGVKEILVEPPDENVLKGNVNIVRRVTINGNKYVVRVHPKGVKNGYYFVEKVALDLARKQMVPTPKIIEVHTASDETDMDFVVMTASNGITMDVFLQHNKSPESSLQKVHYSLMPVLILQKSIKSG